MVYDSATLFSFFEYCDPSALFLRIEQMTVDFEMFPTMTRSFTIIKEEYARIKLSIQYEREVIELITIDQNVFFSFGQNFRSKTFPKKSKKKRYDNKKRKRLTKRLRKWIKKICKRKNFL
jgi:hypothetical protein